MQLRKSFAAGFTLIEMMAVMGIMVIMMALAAPMIGDFATQAGRRGAVNILLNSFENARVAALQSGTNVYIGFADQNFPVEDMRYNSFIIFRDRNEYDTTPDTQQYVYLTGWRQLPDGISFQRQTNSVLNPANANRTINETDNFPQFAAGTLPIVQFMETGGIVQPAAGSGSNPLAVYIYEGFFDSTNNTEVNTSQIAGVDKFSLARFTGRIRHEISFEAI